MATKANPGEFDCYKAAAPDEPLFILRASDALAPLVVRDWVGHYLESHPTLTPRMQRKADEALKCASDMELYRLNKKANTKETPNV